MAIATVSPLVPRRPARPPHLTPQERTAMGRAARAVIPRSANAEWSAPSDRQNPFEVLQGQAASLAPDLVPIRHGRMLASPLGFYRGAAAIMAGDLAIHGTTGLEVQLCGDAHLSNFAVFADPDGMLRFDLDALDETAPGPFEWDVKRLATSIIVAGRRRGFSRAARRRAVLGAVAAYRRSMRRYARMRTLDVWYARIDAAELVSDWDLRLASPAEAFGETGPMTADMPAQWLRDYRASVPTPHRAFNRRLRVAGIESTIVEGGNVGARTWRVLMQGPDGTEPLVLQVSEAQSSVLRPYLGPSVYSHHGRRVVEGRRLVQATDDIFLGWFSGPGFGGWRRDFSVRRLPDRKASVDVEHIPGSRFTAYAELCGSALSRAHARSGDPMAIGAYLGGSDAFDQAVAIFADAYADTNAADHELLRHLAAAGMVEVR
jgi:uncharacterized protein (DUF2252 family)